MTTHTIDIGQFGSLFEDIQQQIETTDFFPVMHAAIQLIADGEKAAFNAGHGPNGEEWAPNAESTKRRKGHGIVLFETGALEKSLVEVDGPGNINDAGSRELIFGTNVSYSLFNEFGTSRIPARPHVGISDQLIDALTEEIADYTVSQLKTP